MSELVGLYLVLWLLVGPEVVVHDVDGPVRFVDLYGVEREAPGALACPVGAAPQLWLSSDAELAVTVHELAHALDCMDDGQLNGSPGPARAERPDWVSDYCWSSDAEWYACWVVHHARMFEAPTARLVAPAPLATPPEARGRRAASPEPPAPTAAGSSACEGAARWEPTPDLLAIGTGSLAALVRPVAAC